MNFIQTGAESLDKYHNGIPCGRITEICGDVDVGKTKLIFNIMDNLSKEYIVAYICTSKNSIGYMSVHNFNNENIIILESNDADTILEFVRKCINKADIFFIDSMTEIRTNDEGSTIAKSNYQNLPMLLRKLYSIVYGESSSLVVINTFVVKDGVKVPRWNNKYQQYCTMRFKFNEEKKIELISDKVI